MEPPDGPYTPLSTVEAQRHADRILHIVWAMDRHMDGLIARACGTLTACVASLGLSIALLTGVFQMLAALFAAVSGAITLWILIRKLRADRAKQDG